jgi:hypothetical protein
MVVESLYRSFRAWLTGDKLRGMSTPSGCCLAARSATRLRSTRGEIAKREFVALYMFWGAKYGSVRRMLTIVKMKRMLRLHRTC